jgi:catechol 2,3-dioxygenase-like lactoylglutathione lyase family enzyme
MRYFRVLRKIVIAYAVLVLLFTNLAEGGDIVAEKDKPDVNVRFLFNHCNDLTATRGFYTDVIGLHEAAYDEEQGYLVYRCEGFQLMFFKAKAEIQVPDEWADQPGYDGGTYEGISWAIEVPEKEFTETVERIVKSGAKVLKETPEWRMDSYWGFTAMDPTGVTVEIYTVTAEKPSTTTWPGE